MSKSLPFLSWIISIWWKSAVISSFRRKLFEDQTSNLLILLIKSLFKSFIDGPHPKNMAVFEFLTLFNLFGDIDISAGVYLSGGGAVVSGIIDKKDVTGNTDQNFFGQVVVALVAATSYEFRADFAGGSGQSPFPSDTNDLYTSFEIEKVG